MAGSHNGGTRRQSPRQAHHPTELVLRKSNKGWPLPERGYRVKGSTTVFFGVNGIRWAHSGRIRTCWGRMRGEPEGHTRCGSGTNTVERADGRCAVRARWSATFNGIAVSRHGFDRGRSCLWRPHPNPSLRESTSRTRLVVPRLGSRGARSIPIRPSHARQPSQSGFRQETRWERSSRRPGPGATSDWLDVVGESGHGASLRCRHCHGQRACVVSVWSPGVMHPVVSSVVSGELGFQWGYPS